MVLHRIIVALTLLTIVPRAYATTADDVCPAATDPCVLLQGTINVTDGSVLDFGDRALVLGGGPANPRLDAGGGAMTVLARSVTLNAGSALLSRGGTITVSTTGDVAVLGNARMDVSEFIAPGSLTLDAGGGVEVQGTLTAQGAGTDSGGGTISIVAMADVILSGTVITRAGGNDIGGDVIILAPLGSLLVSGPIDLTGGFGGGSIDVTVGNNITTFGSGRLDAKATGTEGDGGSVDLVATNGDVVVEAQIEAQGSDGVDFGGSGGDVTVEAALGSVTLSAPIDQSGASPDGDGGDLDVTAGLDIVQTGLVTTLGRSQTGVGGAVGLFAQRAVTVGPVEASGLCKSCAGGDVTAVAWCSLELPAGVVLTVDGGGGVVLFQSGGPMEVHGTARAGQTIDLYYRDDALPPDTAGATLTPAPRLHLTPNLIPCGGPPGINCGNNNVDANETCDDGNKTPCDGCSAICLTEACGDGRVGCDLGHHAEACDDGNTESGDGCLADCSRRDCLCGDGIPECGEGCDTGDAVDCDAGACSATCQIEACPNGREECDEECDDGAASATCTASCTLVPPPTCGNHETEPGEGCDDGNTADCDGCSQFCQEEGCGNGATDCLEDCDDFNTDPCDGCSPSCTSEVCGNGDVDCGEECDEGELNGTPGSSCLAEVCQPGSLCTSDVPGPCIPCGAAADCDPLGRCGGTNCVEGVCTPQTINCTSNDPCFIGSCDVALGCVSAPTEDFESVRCRLTDLDTAIQVDGVSLVARSALGRLLDKSNLKLDAAESGRNADSRGKLKRSLKSSRKKLVQIGKKIVKLQPKQITDPTVGSALSQKATDAITRIDALKSELGL